MNFECDRNFVSGMGTMSMPWPLMILGDVSLTFRELSKIFSRNLCISKIVLVVRMSSWNFVRVPTRTKFQLEILAKNVISGVVYFREIILESPRNVSETPPGLEPMYWLRMIKGFDWHEHLLLIEICYYSAWVSNYTHVKKQDVIIRTCPWR